MLFRSSRIPAQRDTLYRHLVVHNDPALDPDDTDLVVSHFSSTAPGAQVVPAPATAPEAVDLGMPTVA